MSWVVLSMELNSNIENLSELKNEYDSTLLSRYVSHIDSEYDFLTTVEKIGVYAEIRPGMKVLDIGVGNGLSSYYACQNKAYVYGIDFCKEAAHNYSQIVNHLSDKNEAIIGDALSLPFKDNIFDRVIAYNIFHHMPTQAHRKKFINEMKRVTAKNGIIIIGKIRSEVFWMKSKKYKFIQYSSIEQMRELAYESDLTILDISHSKAQKFPNLFSVLPLKYFGHAIDLKLKIS